MEEMELSPTSRCVGHKCLQRASSEYQREQCTGYHKRPILENHDLSDAVPSGSGESAAYGSIAAALSFERDPAQQKEDSNE